MSDDIKIGYKVVDRGPLYEHRLISCSTIHSQVTYALGKWTERPPNCGPLAIFFSLASAKRFRSEMYNVHLWWIFLAEYEPSKDKKLWNALGECIDVPKGTQFANRIRPMELIKDD